MNSNTILPVGVHVARYKPIRNSNQAIGSENAHPGMAVWVPLAILFVLSAAAYFLFLAKATATWPFGN
jgi:hypothetical protein